MKRNLFERIKGYIGIFFIVIAIGGIFFWEKYGREKLLYKEEIVFNQDVKANTIIKREDLITVAIEKDKLIDNSITNFDEIVGKETKIFIPKNAQLHKSYFDDPNVVLEEGQYIFPIPQDWIKAFPDTLRRKDTVYFYEYKEDKEVNLANTQENDSLQAKTYAGTDAKTLKMIENKNPIIKLTVAYIKDGTNREVIDSGSTERENATSKIEKIEIVATSEEIRLLEDSFRRGNKFIIMYR